ncbi:MAG: NUDIX hydrolase [Solirubrobacteraceae bacterium]
MQVDRPAPDERLNPGAAVTPRPAATVILLRGAEERLEILLVKRNPRARFMGGAWVFPGGAVDRREGRGDPALRAAALRELQEEAGIQLSDPQALIGFSRWITPEELKIRFDTWFYLAPAPPGVEARVDGHEVIEARWYEPANALQAARVGEITLVFPTIKHLEQLATFRSATELIEYAQRRTIQPVLPRVLVSGEMARIILPDEPGYER